MVVYRWNDEPLDVQVGDHLAYINYDAKVLSLDEDTKTGMVCEVLYDGTLGESYQADERDLWYGKAMGLLNPPGTHALDFKPIGYRPQPKTQHEPLAPTSEGHWMSFPYPPDES